MLSLLVVVALLVLAGVVLETTARRNGRTRPYPTPALDDRDWVRVRDDLRAAAQRS